MILRPVISIPIAVLLSLSCESGARLRAIENRDVTVVLKATPSLLVEKADRVAEASETRITSQKEATDEFQKAQFVNRKKGWACSYRSVYITSDEGKTWERLTFKAPENSRISSFSFVDESRGWLAVWKNVYSERYGLGNSSIIFNTEDGGRTWHEQANFPDEVDIRQITFLDANRGIAIGSRMIDPPPDVSPPYGEMLVLRTDDGGNTWREISQPVKDALARENAGPGDYGFHLRWIAPTEIFLLTRYARVLRSSDSGATWKTIIKFESVPSDENWSTSAYKKIIFDPQLKLRVIGGDMGPEGFWGDLVVSSNETWTSYQLMRGPIQDAIFLSSNEVLAAGVWLPHVDEGPASKVAGVILKTVDLGKNWTPIYRSKRAEMFISLTRISEKEFYAVSDAGTFLRFSLR